MKKLFLSLFVALVAVLALASCTDTATVSSIELDTEGAKLEYYVGEDLDVSGVKVMLLYSNNTSKEANISSCVVDSSLFDKEKVGEYEIKVSYNKIEASYKVKVVEKPVEHEHVFVDGECACGEKDPNYSVPVATALEIDASKAKVEYLVGEGFVEAGIAVSIVYDNGEKAPYMGEDYAIDASAFDSSAAGEYEIKVSLVVGEAELVGSYKVKVTAIEAPFEGVSHKFVASDLSVEGVTDKDAIAAGTVYADYFTVKGSVTHRLNEDATATLAIELAKRSSGKLEFEVTGRAFVILTVSSNGNTSKFALVDELSKTIANDQELELVSGTDGYTVTYTVEAGKYAVVSPDSPEYGGRGVRVLQIEVIEDASYVNPDQGGDDKVEEPQTRVFEVSNIDATELADKANLGGTGYGEFFYMIGSVQARVNTSAEDGSKSVTSVELVKQHGGQVRFELKYPATVTVAAASSGGTNESVIALLNEAGEIIVATVVESETVKNGADGISHVYSTAKSILTYELQPGVYELTSPEMTELLLSAEGTELKQRNVRVHQITVVEHAVEEEGNPIESFTLTADELTAGEGLIDVAWGKLVKLCGSKETKTWKVNSSNKQVLDHTGAELSVAQRAQSGGSERWLQIDLTEFTGKVKLQISVIAAGDSERAIAVVDALGAELVSLTTTDKTEMHVIEVTVDCGALYQVTTSNGYNFYAINFIAVAE